MRLQKAFFVFRLALGLSLVLFVAGIVVPSVLSSRHAANAVSPFDSARTLDIIGVTLTYKFQNIGFAFLGVLFGAVMAMSFASRGTSRRSLTQVLTALPTRK